MIIWVMSFLALTFSSSSSLDSVSVNKSKYHAIFQNNELDCGPWAPFFWVLIISLVYEKQLAINSSI